jgi:hypothetical protein
MKIDIDRYDPVAVVNALRLGHHILGPSELDLVAAEIIEKLREELRLLKSNGHELQLDDAV